MLPELVWGLSATDSYRYNLVWTDEFTRAFASGQWFPRWLPGSWDGLGAPTFYHYPPLFFWVASVIRLPLAQVLSPGMAATLASLFFLGLSAMTMRAWLLQFAGPRASLMGGLLYLAAPFHLYDIYARGSLSEAAALAFLPLLPLAVHRIGFGKQHSVPLLACSYALLILAHMPSALLAGLFLIPPYALYTVRERGVEVLFWIGSGVLLGVGLSAFYLLPAIQLLPSTLHEAWGGAWFEPRNWVFWAPERWPNPGRGALHLLFAAAALVIALIAFLTAGKRAQGSADVRFWSAMAMTLFVLASGFPPFLWELPPLSQVQFPARLTPQIEFAAMTSLILASRRSVRWLVYAAVVVVLALAPVLWIMTGRASRMAERLPQLEAIVFEEKRDAAVFLPSGREVPLPPNGKDGADPTLVNLPERGWLARSATAKVETKTLGDGLIVEVSSDAPSVVIARRFYHPRWQVQDGHGRSLQVVPTRSERLVAWKVPQGSGRYILSAAPTRIEQIAALVSAGASVLLIALFFAVRLSSHFHTRYRPEVLSSDSAN